jgi:hypothetical protein
MLLFTNGCSYTYGDEVGPKKSWPWLLASKLNEATSQPFNVENMAHCGNCNERITRQTVEWVCNNLGRKEEIYVGIMWSVLSRFEYYDTYSNNWIQHSSHDTAENARLYFSKYRSEQQDVWRHYSQVMLLQNFLKSHGIRYYFTGMGYNGLHENGSAAPTGMPTENILLQHLHGNQTQQVDGQRYPFFFNTNLGILEYAKEKLGTSGKCHRHLDDIQVGCKDCPTYIMPRGHPSESAHAVFTDYIAQDIINLDFS